MAFCFCIENFAVTDNDEEVRKNKRNTTFIALDFEHVIIRYHLSGGIWTRKLDLPPYLVQTSAIQFSLFRYENSYSTLHRNATIHPCHSQKVFLTSCLRENVAKGAFDINSAFKCRHLPSFYSA